MALLVLLCFLALASHAYQLVEIMGTERFNCSASFTYFGSLSLSHNLVGDRLLFATDFRNGSLCNYFLTSDQVRILNLSSIVLGVDNTLVGSSKERRESEGCALTSGQCHTRLKVITLLRLFIAGIGEVTVGASSSSSSGNVSDQTILCNESLLYTNIGFDCLRTPYIPFVFYTMHECLVCADEDLHTPPKNSTRVQEEHSPLYWYMACLAQEGHLLGNATLCGESMCVHLFRSGLYLDQCDPENEREMPPWYRMAVHLVARSFNYGDEVAYRDVWWLLGVELLERHCDLKDHTLSDEELAEKDSFFNSFLLHFKTHDQEAEVREKVCTSIEQHFAQHYNETMAKMLFNQWYYKGFKFALSPDRDMKLNAIYLISFVSAIPFILVLIVIYCVFKFRQWRLKLRATQYV